MYDGASRGKIKTNKVIRFDLLLCPDREKAHIHRRTAKQPGEETQRLGVEERCNAACKPKTRKTRLACMGKRKRMHDSIGAWLSTLRARAGNPPLHLRPMGLGWAEVNGMQRKLATP